MNMLALRIGLTIAGAIAAGVVAGAVVISLAGLAYMGLVTVMPPAAAAIIASFGGLAAAAAIIFGSVSMLCGKTSRRASVKSPGESDLAKQLETLVGAEFVSLIASHPRASAASALFAGLAVGARPDLRSALRQLL